MDSASVSEGIEKILSSRRQDRLTVTELLAKGILNSFVLVLCGTVFAVFLFGSYDFFRNVENNKCEMTWMFEYPEYISIKLETEMDKNYPAYGLYAYAEGRHVAPAMRRKFTGIPVLYVPGNAGSYKQVRSFASVALRKWLDSKTPFHFDFFAVDFNEELSGLYGYVLTSQSNYLAAAVERIQSFYEDYHSVVLIGHSMGGIVAKSTIEGGNTISNLIISLSTPHARPIIVFDPEQDLYYFQLSRNWSRNHEHEKVTLVSVAGGDRDNLVPEGFTKWGRHLNVHTTTTAVPGVWASTDHLCIVWCKQFVMAIVRSLFDLVEYKKQNAYYSISEDPEYRLKVLQYHLLKKTAGKSVHGAHREVEFVQPPLAAWNELLVKNYCNPPSRSQTYIMFPMQVIKEKVLQGGGAVDDYQVLLMTTNTESKNWISGCTMQSFADGIRYCSAGDNLSERGELIPHFRRRRKAIHLKYSEISKYSHLVVKMDPFNLKSCINMEVYSKEERSQPLNAKFDTQSKMFYNLTLPMSSDDIFCKLLAWEVSAHTKENETCEGAHNSLAIFQHGNFKVHRFLKNESIIARVSDWNATSANIQLYLDPTCHYTINVRLANLETAGQIFRTYSRLLPSFFASIVLMSLYFQRDAKEWNNFHRVLISNVYYLTIFPGFGVSCLLLFIPNDWPTMLDGPEYFVGLPMFCYLVAYPLVLMIATGAWYLIIVSGNAVSAVFLRILTTRFSRFVPSNWQVPLPGQVADMALEFTFAKFPVLVAVFLVSITLATCGAFGLLAGLCFFVIKLFKMYEDILSDLWRARIRDVADGLSPLNFQFSYAMIWFVITVVNLPSVIHWIKNFSANSGPQWDLSMYICLMVLPTIAVLWQDHVPNFNDSLWKMHRFVFYLMGIATVLWGTFRLYILVFIATMVLITTAMCQLFSSMTLNQNENDNNTDQQDNANQTDGKEKDDVSESSANSSETEEEDSLAGEFPEMRTCYDRIFQKEKEKEEREKSFEKSKSPEKSSLEEMSASSESESESEEDDDVVDDEVKDKETTSDVNEKDVSSSCDGDALKENQDKITEKEEEKENKIGCDDLQHEEKESSGKKKDDS